MSKSIRWFCRSTAIRPAPGDVGPGDIVAIELASPDPGASFSVNGTPAISFTNGGEADYDPAESAASEQIGDGPVFDYTVVSGQSTNNLTISDIENTNGALYDSDISSPVTRVTSLSGNFPIVVDPPGTLSNNGRTDTFSYDDKIVDYTVPATGVYEITAYGGGGGFSYLRNGGEGEEVGGEFELTKGEQLEIVVGGQGAYGTNGGGGGGGSFVIDETVIPTKDGPEPADAPLVIGGGGGGGGNSGGLGASANNSGVAGAAQYSGGGGVLGGGGKAGGYQGAGGGAGFDGDGGNGVDGGGGGYDGDSGADAFMESYGDSALIDPPDSATSARG
jgi:hypothetical protein